jgi:HSP20 family protein
MPEIEIQGIKKDTISKEEVELSMDIFEGDDILYLMIPLAGINLEKISIQLSEDVLSISGEREIPEEIQKIHSKKYYVQECFWGKFSRSVVLPSVVNSNDIKANAENGILTISLPKIPKGHEKNIKINHG